MSLAGGLLAVAPEKSNNLVLVDGERGTAMWSVGAGEIVGSAGEALEAWPTPHRRDTQLHLVKCVLALRTVLKTFSSTA